MKKRKCKRCGDTNFIDETKDYWICQNCELIVSRKNRITDKFGNVYIRKFGIWKLKERQTKISEFVS